MSKELMDALDLLEKEKNISRDSLFDAIENSLITACKNNFGRAENIRVEVDRDTCDFRCFADKEVVELETRGPESFPLYAPQAWHSAPSGCL